MSKIDQHAVTDGSGDNEPLDCPACDGEMFFYDENVIDEENVLVYQCCNCGYTVEI